jgi:glycosyltransferase involved in cell wall biosynthesis
MATAVTSHVDTHREAAAACQAPAVPDAIVATVILPAYNEAAALPTVLPALLVVLDVALAERYEIIVVDDASTDATAAIASTYPCRLLGHRRKQGKGAAVRTGLGAARGHFIVVMDADNTYPADAVPRLVALSDQYDFVRGVRQYSAAHMPLINRIGNKVFDTMLKLMCGLEGHDHLSGLYGLRREALQAMDLTADGFDLEVEIGIKARARRLRATSLPIAYGRRLGEKKLHAWRDGWRILRRSLALAVHDHI